MNPPQGAARAARPGLDVTPGWQARARRFWRRFLGDGQPRTEAPGDLPRTLARLRLAARTRIAAPWVGAYRSAFKGVGPEFAGVREYTPGDDARTVDWRVTARTGRLAVRRYVEERDRHVLFLADVSPLARVGSGDRTLRELAAEVVALVGSAAQAAGDRVGLLAWSDRRELLLPPRRGDAALLAMVKGLLELEPRGTASALALALADVRRVLTRRGVVVVLSPLAEGDVKGPLAALAMRHELLVVHLWDPRGGRGTARGIVPARAGTRAGWGRAAPRPSLPWLEELATVVVAVNPATPLPIALGRTFLARRGGHRA